MSIHQGYITLTLYGQNEQYATLIDIADWDKVKDYRWMVKANKHRPQGYTYAFAYGPERYRDKRGRLRARMVYLHRLIMDAPSDLLVDHKNHDTLDNRRSNLRLATRSTNAANSNPLKGAISGYRGVFPSQSKSKPYRVQLASRSPSRIHVGHFVCPIEAARAYDAAALKLFGEFAVLNFPDEVK